MKPNNTTAHRFKQWAVSLIDRYGYSFTQSANADSYLPTPCEYRFHGKGFDYENEKNKSFGLRNIEGRIADISGQLNLETSANNGTTYTIQIEI